MKIDMIQKHAPKPEKQMVFEGEPVADHIMVCYFPAPTFEFPGGEDSLAAYLRRNVNYPESAVKSGVSGMVHVKFTVSEKGAIDEVKVLKGIGSGCDEEAIRVVRNMPAWKHVRTSGGAVVTNFNLPINFKLPD